MYDACILYCNVNIIIQRKSLGTADWQHKDEINNSSPAFTLESTYNLAKDSTFERISSWVIVEGVCR